MGARLGRTLAALLVAAALAALPLIADDYVLSFMINVLSFTVLTAAWTLFSGTTRYVSLATAAFFGLGVYLVAALGERLAFLPLMAAVAAVTAALAAIVGLATLRLSGIHFTIFTFGLTELIRQLTIWYQVNVLGGIGSYVFLDAPPRLIFWRLLGLAALLFVLGAWLLRSRLGLALRTIGADETVARHAGIDVVRLKVGAFAFSAVFMALAGAVIAPRWTYIDPTIAFNPLVSFETVIMALLGGAGRLWGAVLGVMPMLLVAEFLATRLPSLFMILLGLCFMAIVYFIPAGLLGLIERRRWHGT